MDQFHSRPMAAKTVLVTGASGGIGKATALGLARMGAHLAICGRDRESSEGAVREIGAAVGGQTQMFVADLSDQSQVRRLADQVLQRRAGRLDHRWLNPPTPCPEPFTGPMRCGEGAGHQEEVAVTVQPREW
jgi:NAD(P)-dependent dehydrogenase (short-subunit alcohol dehydrogenase family)